MIDDAKIRPKNVCGAEADYCPPEDDIQIEYNPFNFTGVNETVKFDAVIECQAISKTLGFSVAAIGLYLAM